MTTDFERRVRGLLQAMVDGDPDDGAADAVTCWMVWQKEAADLLALPPASSGAGGAPHLCENFIYEDVIANRKGNGPHRFVPDPAPAAAVADAEREDMRTHRALWRDLFLAEIRRSLVVSPDVDDKAFWRHELAVFDRVFSALSAPDRAIAADAQKGGAGS